ncbi:MAG TPA: HPr-rel-A system PqqD family peptide chaperone [Gaiellaceae bacterium]|nr:HPr-rel-A system PqqD family peptide chaperone [Gaiellaceae bacterium]
MNDMPISNDSRVVRADDVLLTRAGDQGVLVDEASGNVHVVNDTAARIWELCEHGPTVEELLTAMTGEYEVDAAELRPDLEGVLRTFSDLELVTISPAL